MISFFDHLTLIKYLGESDGTPISPAEIERQTSIAQRSLIPCLRTLESLGMVKLVPPVGDQRRAPHWASLFTVNVKEPR